jgi:hypothetical protein
VIPKYLEMDIFFKMYIKRKSDLKALKFHGRSWTPGQFKGGHPNFASIKSKVSDFDY